MIQILGCRVCIFSNAHGDAGTAVSGNHPTLRTNSLDFFKMTTMSSALPKQGTHLSEKSLATISRSIELQHFMSLQLATGYENYLT